MDFLDGGDDFSLSGGKNLGNLFGGGESGDGALTYTRQEAPKAKPAAAPADPNADTALHAEAATVFKYVDGAFQPQGKLGVALMGNIAGKRAKILMYTGSKAAVTSATITANFSYIPQKDHYASFYDDARQNWSVRFDDAAKAEKFA